MNEQNLDYLSKQLKFTGFGEGHVEILKTKLQQPEAQFSLFHQAEFGKDIVTATLNFKKSAETDRFFFNSYSLSIKNENASDISRQTFYINQNQDNITFKEGYNMMSGRAIQKELSPREGEKYQAWLQLDFKETDKNGNFKVKQFHQNYGYDLEKTLEKHPIKELQTAEAKERLMESLQRGNRQSVTFLVADKETKMYIEANPQFKSINLYDGSMKRVNSQTLAEKQGNGQSVKKNNKEEKQQAAAGEEGDAAGDGKKSRNKRQSQSL